MERLKQIVYKEKETPSPTQEAIREVCRAMEAVQTRFSMESDSDLIESCIYEMEALRARYRYLLRQAKASGLTAAVRLPREEDRETGWA